MENNRVIIFDMDGVIIESVSYMLELNKQRFVGSTRKDFEHLFIGNIQEQVRKLKRIYLKDDISKERDRELREAYTKRKVTDVELYEGIAELLSSLASKYKLSINTSAADVNTFAILDRHNIHQYFDKVLTRDLTQSKVEKFKILADYYGVNPKEMLFITDSLGDVMESHELDIPTLVVTYGVHDRSYFDTNTYSHVVGVVDTVEELTSTIGEYMEQKNKQ